MFMEKFYSTTAGDITLYKGDCLEIMPQIDIKFDCCITDPPYGTTACKWDSIIPFEQMWKNLDRLVKKEGAICLFGSEPFSSLLRCSNLKKFKYDWIWDKKCGLGFLDCKFRPLKQHEIISIFSDGGCSNGSKPAMIYYPQGIEETTIQNRHGNNYLMHGQSKNKGFKTTHKNYPKTILQYVRQQGLHPTQKPVELMEYLIKTYTNEGDIVLDFTAGSGTTGIACMNTKRRCVLIEKEEKYCDIIVQRLQDRENELKQFLF